MSVTRPLRRSLTVRLLPSTCSKLFLLAHQLGISASRLVEIAVDGFVDSLNAMIECRIQREQRVEKAIAKLEAAAAKCKRSSPSPPRPAKPDAA